MLSLWRSLVALLVSLSADPVAIDREAPQSAAAVAAAYAAFASEPPPPKRQPAPCPDGKCASPASPVPARPAAR